MLIPAQQYPAPHVFQLIAEQRLNGLLTLEDGPFAIYFADGSVATRCYHGRWFECPECESPHRELDEIATEAQSVKSLFVLAIPPYPPVSSTADLLHLYRVWREMLDDMHIARLTRAPGWREGRGRSYDIAEMNRESFEQLYQGKFKE
jgi:hypothetical protein